MQFKTDEKPKRRGESMDTKSRSEIVLLFCLFLTFNVLRNIFNMSENQASPRKLIYELTSDDA